MLRSATPCAENWIARFGFLLDKSPTRQWGILYDALQSASWGKTAEFLTGPTPALIGDVAHEMRTPLTTITGYLDGVRDGLFTVGLTVPFGGGAQ